MTPQTRARLYPHTLTYLAGATILLLLAFLGVFW